LYRNAVGDTRLQTAYKAEEILVKFDPGNPVRTTVKLVIQPLSFIPLA
jgi:hypothetical protein